MTLAEPPGSTSFVEVQRLAAPGGEQTGLVSFVAVDDFHCAVGVRSGFGRKVEEKREIGKNNLRKD